MADDSVKDQKARAKSLAAKYDEIPYDGSPQEEQHIAHLAALAMLHGIKPAPVESCQFLALGCGDAANMIPMALNYPDSHFIGIDLSQNEIGRANKIIHSLALKNIDLRCFDILDLEKDFGRFDYIIAHGIYSWVPAEVRDKVLAVCRNNLSANGVGLVSYNCKPGFEMREMVRQMLLYHVYGIDSAEKMVDKARKYLTVLAEASNSRTAYGQYIRELEKEVQSYTDSFFRHDLLGEINNAFYFNQFVDNLKKHYLEYVTEADFHSTIIKNYSVFVQGEIESLPGNYIIKQQHLDFIQGRQFRQSIICHADHVLRRDIDKTQLEKLYFGSHLAVKDSVTDAGSIKLEEFYAKDGVIMRTDGPIVKVLWRAFAECWPRPRSFDYFLKVLESAFPEKGPQIKDALIKHLMRGIEMGFIAFYSAQPHMNLQIDECPKVSKLVRYQARIQLWVTNQLHQKIAIDNLSHHVLPLLDGQKNEEAFLNELYQLVIEGKINLSKGGANLINEKQVKDVLKEHLKKLLPLYRNSALLI